MFWGVGPFVLLELLDSQGFLPWLYDSAGVPASPGRSETDQLTPPHCEAPLTESCRSESTDLPPSSSQSENLGMVPFETLTLSMMQLEAMPSLIGLLHRQYFFPDSRSLLHTSGRENEPCWEAVGGSFRWRTGSKMVSSGRSQHGRFFSLLMPSC